MGSGSKFPSFKGLQNLYTLAKANNIFELRYFKREPDLLIKAEVTLRKDAHDNELVSECNPVLWTDFNIGDLFLYL